MSESAGTLTLTMGGSSTRTFWNRPSTRRRQWRPPNGSLDAVNTHGVVGVVRVLERVRIARNEASRGSLLGLMNRAQESYALSSS